MDDDELRDEFGNELTAALSNRSRAGAVADVEGAVTRGTRRTRVRRRIVAASVAAAVVIAGVGVVATRPHGSPSIRVSTPTSTSTTTIPVSPGHRLVALDGVHVEVPAAWPIVDGMHTGFCGGVFPATPTAFVGPQENGAPSCPYFTVPRRDGVWLWPGARPPDGHAVTAPSGVVLLEESTGANDPVRLLWYHGDYIEIGLGSDTSISSAILASIGYSPGVADTPGSGACARSSDASTMPTPERLTHEMVLENGNVTLRPPAPSDQAITSASSVWSTAYPRNYERYRIILARYSEKLPATLQPDGSLEPDNVNVLAWIVYAVPITPIEGCGMYGLDATNALTGKGMDDAGYSIGP
jgi:hypothetical protein